MRSSLLSSVLAVALLVDFDCCLVVAFSLSCPTSRKTSSSLLWAKPPSISAVDLRALEAFEKKMDLEALDDSEDDLLHDDDDDEEDFSLELSTDDSNVCEFTVPEELHNKRIDAVVSALIEPSLSRSVCGNLVTDGNVQLVRQGDDKKSSSSSVMDRKSYKVPAGTTLRVLIPKDEKPLEIVAQDLALDILYEDEHMVILNKASGMVVHPAAGNWDGTVVNAMAYYLANHSPYGSGDFVGSNGGVTNTPSEGVDGEAVSFRPGIVHRLDKGTTGILVVAKTTQALGTLSAAFAARSVKKTYLAITVGNPGKKVVIDKPIGRHPMYRQRMRVVPDPHRRDSSGMAPKDRLVGIPSSKSGRRALSFVDTLAFDGKLSFCQVRIETGRTHQIRVHLQDRHTPIYGDDIYGIADWNRRLSKTHAIARPLLHAYRLELDHPVTGERMVFTAPMAADMKKIANTIWPDGETELPEGFV